MGQVVGITREADRRAERERSKTMFPGLRWVAGRMFYVAHRDVDGVAACGARGDLILAPPGVPECVVCFPLADRDAP